MECGKLNSSLWVNRLLKSDLIYVLFMCKHYYTSQCEWTLKRTKTSVIDSFVNYKADILGTLNVPQVDKEKVKPKQAKYIFVSQQIKIELKAIFEIKFHYFASENNGYIF